MQPQTTPSPPDPFLGHSFTYKHPFGHSFPFALEESYCLLFQVKRRLVCSREGMESRESSSRRGNTPRSDFTNDTAVSSSRLRCSVIRLGD